MHADYSNNDPGRKYKKSYTKALDKYDKFIAICDSIGKKFNNKYQKEDKMLYNLEATPAESTSYRLAQNDNKIFGKNISYYTNSSIIPSDIDCGLITNLRHQESLQTIYSGGTVFHTYLGEDIKWE